VAHVVDLDRAEPEPLEPASRSSLADEPRQVVAGGAVAEAAEVDAGEHQLTVTLVDAAADLLENRLGAPAARRTADERDDAEAARERAAVLDLHERSHAVEPGVGLHAADRPHVARHRGRGSFAALGDDGHVGG